MPVEALGYAVTVVDRSGIARTMLRADHSGLHTVDASQRKAYTALSTKTPTGTLAAASSRHSSIMPGMWASPPLP